MNSEKYLISHNASILQAIVALNQLSDDNLTLFIVDDNKTILGSLTDGDIRRYIILKETLSGSVQDAMFRDFKFIRNNQIDVETIKHYKNQGIDLIPSIDDNSKLLQIYNLKNKLSILPIDAVLMAGGKGIRLLPLTEKTPKPLLPVGEKTIIDHNVDRLISYGIENISVTINYLHEQIKEHFNEKRNGIQINCVKEPKYLGTIGSVKFVDCFYNETVLVMNSDLFTNIDYEDFYLHFKQNNADMSVAAVPYSVVVPYGIFDLSGNSINGVKEKPTYNYFANAGIYMIKRELLNMIPDNIFYDATDFIDLLIKNEKKITRYPITGYWIDIGKHEDYNKANELIKHL